MQTSRRWPLALAAAGALSGCGGAFDVGDAPSPPERPSKADLDHVVKATRQPSYWLGTRFRGVTISSATVSRSLVSLTYDPWTCDSGCTDAGGVSARRRDLIRQLKPLNAKAPWPLPRPRRITCRQLRRVDKRYRLHMPAAFRPTHRC